MNKRDLRNLNTPNNVRYYCSKKSTFFLHISWTALPDPLFFYLCLMKCRKPSRSYTILLIGNK